MKIIADALITHFEQEPNLGFIEDDLAVFAGDWSLYDESGDDIAADLRDADRKIKIGRRKIAQKAWNESEAGRAAKAWNEASKVRLRRLCGIHRTRARLQRLCGDPAFNKKTKLQCIRKITIVDTFRFSPMSFVETLRPLMKRGLIPKEVFDTIEREKQKRGGFHLEPMENIKKYCGYELHTLCVFLHMLRDAWLDKRGAAIEVLPFSRRHCKRVAEKD